MVVVELLLVVVESGTGFAFLVRRMEAADRFGGSRKPGNDEPPRRPRCCCLTGPSNSRSLFAWKTIFGGAAAKGRCCCFLELARGWTGAAAAFEGDITVVGASDSTNIDDATVKESSGGGDQINFKCRNS